jgi:hypothetical protein
MRSCRSDKFPDPEALVAAFHKRGMRVVANVKPCLLDDHPHFAEVQQGACGIGSGIPSLRLSGLCFIDSMHVL